MRLYLSSFRLGDHPEHLRSLVGREGGRAVVIANAIDHVSPRDREDGVERELTALAGLGFEVSELDLRDYFGEGRSVGQIERAGRQVRLRRDLENAAVAWVRGGNVFMLRYALWRSGGDTVLREVLDKDALVYAGYSAGPCVLMETLRGLDVVDDPDEVRRTYGAEPVWHGLGVLREAFVPHYRSPEHPESAAMEVLVQNYESRGITYHTLRDGQVLVVNGDESALV